MTFLIIFSFGVLVILALWFFSTVAYLMERDNEDTAPFGVVHGNYTISEKTFKQEEESIARGSNFIKWLYNNAPEQIVYEDDKKDE